MIMSQVRIDGEGIQAYLGVQIFDREAMKTLQAATICNGPLSEVEDTDVVGCDGLLLKL